MMLKGLFHKKSSKALLKTAVAISGNGLHDLQTPEYIEEEFVKIREIVYEDPHVNLDIKDEHVWG